MNLMNKIKPITYKFVQIVYICNKIIAKRNPSRVLSQYPQVQIPFLLTVTFAFPWSLKKKKKDAVENTPMELMIVLDKADSLFENAHYEQCYNLLKEYEQNNNNVEIQWRICRVLYNMSKELKYDKSYKQSLIYEAYKIISEQLDQNQNHYAVHKWYALLLDAKSSEDGVKERIRQLETIKKHMDVAITINPNDATILYMLGEWCYQVADLPWHQRKIAEVLFGTPPYSTYQDALEYFLRAEAVKPRFYSLNLLRIGMCYYKLRKEDQAKYYLQLAASYPAKSNDDHSANKEAAIYLKKIK